LNSDNSKLTSGPYYPALDGLRGLAILMIVFYHIFDFLPLSKIGWTGVDLFFVLSGFLITGVLLKKRNFPYYFRNFYARRVLRIFPIYYLSLIIFLFILPIIINYPFSLNYFLSHQLWFWLEIQNWLFIFRPEGNNNFLNHFWSLALEEQFYLICPFVFLLIKKAHHQMTLILFTLLLLLVLRLTVWRLDFHYISYVNLYAFTRIDGLCVGCLLAIFKNQGNFGMGMLNKILGLFFLILIFIVIPLTREFYHFKLPYVACCVYPVIAIFWGGILWTTVGGRNLVYRIFSSRAIRFIGKISYGFYIFHWPVDRLLRLKFESVHIQQHQFWESLFPAVISTSLTILLSVISYYCYERYFLGLKKYFD
jgi:peptidoglycan/LPS O-acetylase OafA/YrhL